MMIGVSQTQTASLRTTMSLNTSQAISLLQYSSTELLAFLQEETIRNPLIELDHDFRQADQSFYVYKSSTTDPLDFISSQTVTLAEHLLGQLRLERLSSQEQEAGRHIIYSLDENGYLTENPADIAALLQTDIQVVKKVLDIIQKMDPSGVGARDLKECLFIQLQSKKQIKHSEEQIFDCFFEDFALKKWDKIVNQSSLTLKDIQELYDKVLMLDPKPGKDYGSNYPIYISPDYYVQLAGDKLVLTAANRFSSNVKWNRHYQEKLRESNSPDSQKFLQDKYKEYQWLVKALQVRELTLDKVVRNILEKQEIYFKKGPDFIKPLKMRDLAEEVNVHESTISRCVKNKFIETPYGTVSLKSFFNRSTIKADGAISSTLNVKRTISTIVSKEDKCKPLSDQKIADMLKIEYNYQISRRTVAKYRDQLKILPASYRKVRK